MALFLYRIIEKSYLSASIQEKCHDIFTNLATAEAKIHNTTKQKVHLHEVGSLDTIIDVVGAVSGIELLGIRKVYASPIHIGRGFTKCIHGITPLPAPATLELLKDIPLYSEGIKKELVTPTGAAIISTLCKNFGNMPTMSIKKIGYGAGTRNLEIPNLLRLTIGEKNDFCSSDLGSCRFGNTWDIQQGSAIMIQANIDDMNPEFYDYLFTKVFEVGALDVYLQKVQMKKNRPGIIINILAHHENVDKISEILFKETTTIGLRVYPVTKYMLPYEIKTVSTGFGNMKIKIARFQNAIVNVAPEYEDCRRKAAIYGLPIKKVYDRVKLEGQRILEDIDCGEKGSDDRN